MVVIPTIHQEESKRRRGERENLVGMKTQITNRIKAALIRIGIRGFRPELRRGPQKVDALRTPEGLPIVPNTLDETHHDMARSAMVREQIDLIEQARLARIEQALEAGPNAMVRSLAGIIGVGVETPDMFVLEVLSRHLRDHRGGGARRRANRLAGRKWLQTVSEGTEEVGQCPGPPRPDPTHLRFLPFQKDSALAQWCRTRTEGPNDARRNTVIQAFARCCSQCGDWSPPAKSPTACACARLLRDRPAEMTNTNTISGPRRDCA
jgi:transposase